MGNVARILLALDVRKATGLTTFQVVETLDGPALFIYHLPGFRPRDREWITLDWNRLWPLLRSLSQLTFRFISRRSSLWLRGTNRARSKR